MFTRNGTTPKAAGEPQRIDALRLQSLSPATGRNPTEPPPPPHQIHGQAETIIPASAANNDGANTGISIIGRDLTIIGQGLRIISKGKIRVEGEIQGDVLGTEVIIGDVGKVTGVVSAETITVFGSIAGTIRGVRVLLESGARVEGDVHHQTLSVDEGARLEGRVRRASDVAELKPDLTNGTSGS